ncbi:hypothetical protein DSECCO2_392580 [anaerobic digester metagenome]
MYVYVTGSFQDKEHGGAERRAGSLLLVSDTRGKQIIQAGYGRKIEPIDLTPAPLAVEEEPEEEKAAEEEPKAEKKTAAKKR